MFALRTMIRCNSAINNISKSTLESVRFVKIGNICSSTNALLLARVNSRVQEQKKSAALNSVFIQRRSFFANSAEDIDVNNLERIYYGTLAPRIRALKVFSLTTSVVGLSVQPVLMEQGVKISGTGLGVFLCCFAGFFTFVTPLLIHFVTKKYVTEIHYNPDTTEYVATTINILLKKVRTKFLPSDVTIPEVPGMFTSFKVGNRPLFVDPSLFDNTEHYVRIMGYDKPIDFKLNLKEATCPPAQELNKSKK